MRLRHRAKRRARHAQSERFHLIVLILRTLDQQAVIVTLNAIVELRN
jgi:hypothetical protein